MVGFARCRRVVDRVEQILDDEAYHDHSKMGQRCQNRRCMGVASGLWILVPKRWA